jgi:ketosteroid isomerase-like protein
MSAERQLRELVDRQAITELLNEYCRALDLMDLDSVAAVFTADCVVEYGPEERLRSRGAAGVAQSLQRMWRWARTSHHLSNVQIVFKGANAARATSYVLAWHERPDGSTATIWGQYQDILTRTPAGWRIARRTQMMNGNDAGFTVNIHRLKRRKPPPGWVAPNIDRPVPRGRQRT